MAISNSASPEIIWGLGGPEEDHQHHCCWIGHVGEREEEEEEEYMKEVSSKRMNLKTEMYFDIFLNEVLEYTTGN